MRPFGTSGGEPVEGSAGQRRSGLSFARLKSLIGQQGSLGII